MGITILLVEDDASVRELLKVLLEVEGYDIVEASDGQDGLEKAGEAPGRHLEARLLDDLPAQGLRQDLGPLDPAPRQRPPAQGRRLSPPDEQQCPVVADRHRADGNFTDRGRAARLPEGALHVVTVVMGTGR